MSKIRIYKGDLPNLLNYNVPIVSVDTETLGLNIFRDRLCIIQLAPGDGTVDIVQIFPGQENISNIKKIFTNPKILKIFHFARFDISIIMKTFKFIIQPIFCTKIASKLSRTYSDKHDLKELCYELLNIKISKKQQLSDWSSEILTNEQMQYASEDVLYLHKLKFFLEQKLIKSNRLRIAKSCFKFLPIRSELDLIGWNNQDIFSHS